MKKTICTLIPFLLGLFLSFAVLSQPSGGPYGPVQQFYELPDVPGVLYYVSPDGDPGASGKALEDPMTLESAISRVTTGDAIVLRGGTYRTGDLILNQGITMQPYADELPVLKGTYLATEWQYLGNNLWRTPWKHLFPMTPDSWWRKEREGIHTPLHRFNNDMVFINGRFLQSAGWLNEITEDTYYIDYREKMVYIGTDPTDKQVEITAFNIALERVTVPVHGKQPDKIGPVIKGITFTQYAFQGLSIDGTYAQGPMDESELGKEVVGTTLEHCEISFCGRVGAWLMGDQLTMRHCKVSDTSTEGVYINCSNDVLLERNIFTRNNIERITGYYPAAVKIFNQTHRVTCNDNLITDLPYSNGIWYDVGNVDGVFTNNWLENVGFVTEEFSPTRVWPSQNAFFFEISKGALLAGNVFVNCDHGMLILNSCNVKVYQNTFINSLACFGRDQRSAEGDHFGWHPQTGPGVEERTGHEFINNLLVGNENFTRPLLFIWQPDILCERLTEPALKKLDHNVYVNKKGFHPIIWLNQKLNGQCKTPCNTTAELNKAKSEYAANSKSLMNYKGPLFKSSHLGDYRLMNDFPGTRTATESPDFIYHLTGKNKERPYMGAYPDLVQE